MSRGSIDLKMPSLFPTPNSPKMDKKRSVQVDKYKKTSGSYVSSVNSMCWSVWGWCWTLGVGQQQSLVSILGVHTVQAQVGVSHNQLALTVQPDAMGTATHWLVVTTAA